MPLPDDNKPWPPPEWEPVKAQVDEAMVWYRGTATEITEFYATKTTSAATNRRLWQRLLRDRQSTASAHPAARIHAPLAAAIAKASADLLFRDMPSFEMDEGSPDHLAELVEADGIHRKLLAAAEIASGVGGVFLRPMWDRDLVDRPVLLTTLPGNAIPEFKWGLLRAVTLWTKVDEDRGVVLRHVERYEPGVILHGLYRGDSKRLGLRVSLGDHQSTAGFAATAVGNVGVVDVRPFGITSLPCRYIPNKTPNRRLIDHPVGQNMGESDTAGLEGEMDALDHAYSSLDRELELAKLRIVVPEEYLKGGGRGGGMSFDTDQQVFSPLNIEGRANDRLPEPQVVSVPLRVREHMEAAQGWVDQIVAGAGYGAAEVGRDADGGVQTATEVDAKGAMSNRTTAAKRGLFGDPLADVLEQMMLIHRGVFDAGVDAGRPTVVWPEPAEDLREMASSLNLLSLAGAASTETKVRMLRPDWDDGQVSAEVGRIREDEGVMDDPTGGFP